MSTMRKKGRAQGPTMPDEPPITLPLSSATTDGQQEAGETQSRIRGESTSREQPPASHPPPSASQDGTQETGRRKGRIRDEPTAHLQHSQPPFEVRHEASKRKSRTRGKDPRRQPSASVLPPSTSLERRHKAGRKMSRARDPTHQPSAFPEPSPPGQPDLSPTSVEGVHEAEGKKSLIREESHTDQPRPSPSHNQVSPDGVAEADEKNSQVQCEPPTQQHNTSPPLPSTPNEGPRAVRIPEGSTGEEALTGQPPSSLPQSPTSREERQETGEQKSCAQKDALVDHPAASLALCPLSSSTSPVGVEQTGSKAFPAPEQAPVDPVLTSLPLSPTSPEELQEAGPTTTIGATGPATTPAAFIAPLDHILIFGHGRYQMRVLFCTTLAFFANIVHAVAGNVLARPVDHWCKIPPEYSSFSPETWKNASLPWVAGGETHSQCFRYEPPLPVTMDGAGGNRTVVPCDYGWDYDLASGVRSIVIEWDLVCGRSWIKTLLDAAYMLGGVVGAPIAGITADNVGRRPVLVMFVFLLMIAGIALPFALTLALFCILLFALSAAASSTLVTSLVLLFEVTDTQHRAQFCGFAVAGATLMATVYNELVYGLIYDWKIAQIAYMVPTCGLVLGVYLMDESPCLILAASDFNRAEGVLAWAAQVNGMEPEEFNQRLKALRESLERQADTTGLQSGGADTIRQEQDVNVFDLVTNKTLSQRSAVIFGCCFLLFGILYSLSTGKFLRGDRMGRFSLLLLRLPGLVADVFILGRVGRRLALVSGMLALSAGTAALAAALVFVDNASLITALVVLNLLIFDLSAVAVFTFSAELYPTVVRGAGVGLCYSCGRLGALLTPFFNDIRSLAVMGALYAVYSALLLVFGLLANHLPETTQLQPANTLRDMAARKWHLSSPLRVARRRSMAGKHTSKSTITVSSRHRNRRKSYAAR